MTVKKEKVFVDSINEKICTVLAGEKSFSISLSADMLPSGTSEGDWLIMTLKKSDRVKRSYRRSLKNILEKL
ncbi:MAG: hypothetical protein PHO18_05405 [Synergistaceae bacterium]|nr:hypothetical protein [Synergistaceae bacterium]